MFLSPQMLVENAMRNSQVMQNPMGRNVISMIQRGDSKGLEALGRNICKERGIDPDDALRQVQSMFLH